MANRAYDDERERIRAREDHEWDKKHGGCFLLIILLAVGIYYLIGEDNFYKLVGNKNGQYESSEYKQQAIEIMESSYGGISTKTGIRLNGIFFTPTFNKEDLSYSYLGSTYAYYTIDSRTYFEANMTYKALVKYNKDLKRFVQFDNSLTLKRAEYNRVANEVDTKIEENTDEINELLSETPTIENRKKVIKEEVAAYEQDNIELNAYKHSLLRWVYD